MFKPLYTWAFRESVVRMPTKTKGLDWYSLSNKLSQKFGPTDRNPVGKVNVEGIEFKLNFLNYYPLLPTVKVVEERDSIVISQYYDKKARFGQIYWVSIFLGLVFLLPFFLILELSNPASETTREDWFAVVFFELLYLMMLVLFVIQRCRLWRKSFEKAEELLSVLGVKPKN